MDGCTYVYSGPVLAHGVCVANKWTAETWAPSEKKARSNLVYRFKKENNRLPGTNVELPGKIERKGVTV